MDNSNIGLNANLQPLDSPIVNYQGAVTSYDFSADNDRSAISLAKIKNLDFSTAFGGTLTLGGNGNGNGQLFVQDSSGSTIVTLNNAGVAVTGGNISVYNASGSLTFDANGLVSATNFASDGTVDNSTRSTNSLTPSDVSNTSLTFSLARSNTKVLINATVNCQFSSMGAEVATGVVFMNIDGSNQSFPMSLIDVRLQAAATVSRTVTLAYSQILTFASGSHTIKLQFQRNASGGNPNYDILNTSVLYIVLGT